EAYGADMWDDLLDQMTWEEQRDLVMLAGYGTRGAASVALPEIKAEDGPTGVVDSAENVSFPSEGIWAASFNRDLLRKVGDALAEDALNVGVTGMYLPGVNIHRTPFGGRAHEYFSEDPYLSAEAVASEVQGVQAKGVIPYVKHFVFNDQEDSRIGIGIWLNEQSAREIYLKPFEAAVAPSKGNAHGVMSSFNRAGCVWTSASRAIMEDILRGEFGFDGVVLTDMALGQNAYMSYDAFLAGTDLFLDPTGNQAQFDGYADSPAFRQAVRQAARRYLYVIANFSAAMNGFSSGSKIVPVMPWWQALILGLQIAFFVLGAACAVMLAIRIVQEPKKTVRIFFV
ncbi:MAG: glycoside hydrolase family 3 protein, partial [Clostridia bacterium]|nr:glycoside hydrolase family 3 protein [Clostridia bacterium]